MKKIYLLTLFLLLTFSAYTQEPLVKINFKDGTSQTIKLDDIELMGSYHSTRDWVLEIFDKNKQSNLIPLDLVEYLKLEIDSSQKRYLNTVFFDFDEQKYNLQEIDSLIFRRLENKFVDNLTVFEEHFNNDLISVDSNKIVLKGDTKFINIVSNGNYIAGGISKNAPDGFLKLIKSIKNENGKIVFEVEDASITDVMISGVIAFKEKVYLDTAKTGKVNIDKKNKEVLLDDAKISFQTQIELIDNMERVIATVTPNVSYELIDIQNILIIEDYSLKKLLFSVHSKRTIAIDGVVNLGLSMEKFTTELKSLSDYGVPSFYLTAITIPIPTPAGIPIPFIISPKIDFKMNSELYVGSKINFGASRTTEDIYGFDYNGTELLKINKVIIDSSRLVAPKFALSGIEASFSIGPYLTISPYRMNKYWNLYTAILPKTSASVNFLESPWWKIKAGVELGSGFYFKIPAVDKEYNLKNPISLSKEGIIAQSENWATSITPKVAAAGDTITIKGSSFGEENSKSKVTFRFGETLLPEDIVEMYDFVNWSDTEIKLIIPQYLDSGLKYTYISVNDFMSNPLEIQISAMPYIEKINPDTLIAGKNLQIDGKNFGNEISDNSFVVFNGKKAPKTNIVWNDKTIHIIVPDSLISGLLWVEVDGKISNKVPFFIFGPFIESVSPDTAKVGDLLTVKGKNFGKNPDDVSVFCKLSEYELAAIIKFENWNDTAFQFVVPKDAKVGPNKLYAYINKLRTNEVNIFIDGPYIDNISPDSVEVGDQITINGRNFGNSQGTSKVSFGVNYATEYISWTNDKIIAKVPNGTLQGELWVEVEGVESNKKAYKMKEEVIDPNYCDCGWEVDYSKLVLKESATSKYYTDSLGRPFGPAWNWFDDKKTKFKSISCYNLKNGQVLLHGRHREWYENQNKKFDIIFDFQVYHGYYHAWFETGQKAQEYNFNQGKYEGTQKEWFANGQQYYEYNIYDGKNHGKQAEWLSNGYQVYEKNYKYDVLHGRYAIWNTKTGYISQDGNYSDGKKDGTWTDWAVKDTLEKIENYKEDKLHGECTYYVKGQKSKILNYSNGKLNGNCIYNLNDNSKTYEQEYLNNIQHGKYVSYHDYDLGVIKTKGQYTNGKKTGVWWWYNEDGSCSSGTDYGDGSGSGKEVKCP